MLGKYKINYIDNNKDAEVVVFLHGWGGSSASFKTVAQKLSEFRIINIDFPGFGESSTCPNMDIYEYAESIYLLLSELDIKRCSIVAHSFGGRVAVILSALYDIEITHLVLTGSAGLKPRKSFLTWLKVKKYKAMKWLVKKHLLKVSKLAKYGSEDYKSLSPEMKNIFVKVVNQHLDFLVPLIKNPVLLVWGEQDKSTPYNMAKRFTKLLPNSGLVTYSQSGHFAYLENINNFCEAVNYFINN